MPILKNKDLLQNLFFLKTYRKWNVYENIPIFRNAENVLDIILIFPRDNLLWGYIRHHVIVNNWKFRPWKWLLFIYQKLEQIFLGYKVSCIVGRLFLDSLQMEHTGQLSHHSSKRKISEPQKLLFCSALVSFS